MKLYKTKPGIVIEKDSEFFLIKDENWDSFINDDNLFDKVQAITESISASVKKGNEIY